jgi:hypothetical protein
MRMWNVFKTRIRSLLLRKRAEMELDEELRVHIEREIERKVKSGSSTEDARCEAEREFGGLERLKEECRDARGWQLLDALMQDARYGLRVLLRAPAFLFAVALGKRIRMGRDGPWVEVLGVAENVYADGLTQPAPPTVYFRVGLVQPDRPGRSAGVRRTVTFAIRSERAGTEVFLREIATAIHAVNASLPLAKVRTLNDVYRQSMARTSFALVLLGIAGAMALTLAIVGVYGVLAYAVAQRRREVSIRLALGAEPRECSSGSSCAKG